MTILILARKGAYESLKEFGAVFLNMTEEELPGWASNNNNTINYHTQHFVDLWICNFAVFFGMENWFW